MLFVQITTYCALVQAALATKTLPVKQMYYVKNLFK